MNACPHCDAVVDAHDAVGFPGVPPRQGDVSVCAYCCGIGVFDELGLIRAPTLEERSRLLADPRVLEAQAALVSSPSIADAVARARRTHAGRN